MTTNNLHALLSNQEMYLADSLAVEGGVASLDLMEAAGSAVARALMARWSPSLTVVLCGPGNNGGDGFVVARHLAEAGLRARVALLGDREALKGDAATMADRWRGEVVPLSQDALEGADLVVDALFGAGLTRELGGEAAALAKATSTLGLPCLAVDMPSGVEGDTGQFAGTAFKANLTVTFFRRKPGHLLMPGRALCGEVETVDIGIRSAVVDGISPATFANHPDLWGKAFPWPRLEGHKYDRGHAVVVSGGPANTGAGRLAAGAALRVGAGLVTLACPTDALAVAAAQVTAVMTLPFEGAEGLEDILVDKRKNTVLLGPANGVGKATRQNVLAALGAGRACVLDADALTSFADQPEALFTAISGPSIMTPHAGEFDSIFSGLAEEHKGKLELTRAAASQSGAVVLLKGPDSVIAAPDGRAAINANAPPELATAGSGDVLAGLALGLLSQGMPAFEAACAATWLHAEAATTFGPGLIAEDLEGQIPGLLRELRRG